MTAHPRYDSTSDRLVCYDYKPTPLTGTALRLFEFESDYRLVGNKISQVRS